MKCLCWSIQLLLIYHHAVQASRARGIIANSSNTTTSNPPRDNNFLQSTEISILQSAEHTTESTTNLQPIRKPRSLSRRTPNTPPTTTVRLENLSPAQNTWIDQVLSPDTSIATTFTTILKILYANDATLPRPPVPVLSYVITDSTSFRSHNHHLVSSPTTKQIVFNLNTPLDIYRRSLHKLNHGDGDAHSATAAVRAGFTSDEDAEAFAVAATRMTMNGLVLYYATHYFQWLGDDPAAANLVAGVREWVSLKAGFGLLEWGVPFKKPAPGQDINARGAMAWFIDWLPALAFGGSDGRMVPAGCAINAKLRTGYTGERFWSDLFGMPLGVLWEGWQIHLRSLEAVGRSG